MPPDRYYSMKNFQLIVLIIFVTLAVAGVAVFSLYGTGSRDDTEAANAVTIWGIVSEEKINGLLGALFTKTGKNLKITYVEKNKDEFNTELIEALASGRGPDIILLPQDLIVRYEDKIYPLSYEQFNERTFRDTFIQESELYLSAAGILAFPFSVDPLVLYWNRDLFASQALVSAPSYWDELFALVPRLTIKNDNSIISQAGIALGEYRNVRHAKDILSTILLQSGIPISRRGADGKLEILIGQDTSTAASESVRFFTEFSNPVKPSYSWNRSLPDSQNAFISGDLAMYIGYAGEVGEIRQKNPNLNFDVAPLPQIREARSKTTFGRMEALAVLKSSKYLQDAFTAVTTLTNESTLTEWTSLTDLPPVRDRLVSVKQTDAYRSVFFDSAIIARAWLDPRPQETDAIFQTMIESVTAGKADAIAAVKRAGAEMEQLLK